jgi:hypothetical protein
MSLKIVSNANPGTADIVGGNDWDSLATLINTTGWLTTGFRAAGTVADVFVYRDVTSGYTMAISAKGTIHSRLLISGNNDDTVIQAAFTNCPAGGTICILPSSDGSPYVYGEHLSVCAITKDVTVLAYGAVIRAGTTVHHGAIWFSSTTNAGLNVRFFGGTYDNKSISTAEDASGNARIFATVFGHTYGKKYNLFHLRDITIKNFYSNGVSMFPPSGGATPSATAAGTVIIENVFFDTVANVTFKPSNECIVCADTYENFVIKNTYMMHTKGWFVIAENLKMDNCTVNAQGWGQAATGNNSSSMCKNVELKNIRLLDCAMSIRMYGNPDDSLPVGNCENVVVDGFVAKNIQGAVYYPIQIRGYYHTANTTYYNVENVTISNAYFDYAPIIINRPTGATIAAKVKHLSLRNCYFKNCRTDIPALVYVTDQNIDYLEIDGVYFDVGWGGFTDPALVRVYADNINSTVARAVAKNIYPAPLKGSSQHLGYLKADSTFTATITFDRPLIDNSNNCIKKAVGGGTEVGNFLENWGSMTFTGNASTTAFNIAHLLSATPTFYIVNGDTDDSAAPFSSSVDSSNIVVTYPFAPPTPASGSDNLSFRWSAKVL